MSAAACSAAAGSARSSPSDLRRPGDRAARDGSGEQLAECVVNFSEGRDLAVVAAIGTAGGDRVLDVHSDPTHHRSVLTLGGPLDAVEAAARAVVARAVELIDLRAHTGVHPRFGAADVVPFVTLPDTVSTAAGWDAVLGARNRLATWAGEELALPCFLYGPERSLPDVRRRAFSTLAPDTGPPRPHPSAGAAAVGARGVLVAYNVWLAGSDEGDADVTQVARSIAADLRGPAVRALGFALESGAQVSVNLIDPANGRGRSRLRPGRLRSRVTGLQGAPCRAGRSGAGGRPRGGATSALGRTGPERGIHHRAPARHRRGESGDARSLTGRLAQDALTAALR